MFRNLGALALAASVLMSSTAYAATVANQGALAQGVPASVKQAQSHDDRTPLCWILGAGVVIGGIVLIASGNGHGAIGSSTECALGEVNCPPPTPPPPPPTTTTSSTTSTSSR